MNTDNDTQTCSHEGCECTLTGGEGVMVDGALYCSSGCAQGKGCDHEDCNCAES